MVEEDRLQFIFSEDFASGEGNTISLMITRAYPRHEDYVVDPNNKSHKNEDGSFHFVMPTLKENNTPRFRAAREFAEKFGGGWSLYGAEFLSRQEFLAKCGRYLPEHVVKFLGNTEDDSGNFKYYSQWHVNYS